MKGMTELTFRFSWWKLISTPDEICNNFIITVGINKADLGSAETTNEVFVL